MKYFIITVDTEGDDLWHYNKGTVVRTENAVFIPRFQELCESYGFKPVYLTNYEMINDPRFVEYIKPKAKVGLCEVGIHIHAWNNPPLYDLKGDYNGNPYLIEYPEEVMRQKLLVTANLIKDKIGIWPVSHRAGRWAMNDVYFRLLRENGIKVDCSYTPHVNWKACEGKTIPAGANYAKVQEGLQRVDEVLEVPVSIRDATFYRFFRSFQKMHIRSAIWSLTHGCVIWERPSICSTEDMFYLTRRILKEKDTPYIEMMIHSSELMPGGSPYFKDAQSIEQLYSQLTFFFDLVTDLGYKGITLEDFEKVVVI